jgi:hypothetical protein
MIARRLALAGCIVALASVVGLIPGCTRKPPQFVPPEADSAATAAADSFAVLVGDAREQWESTGGASAASMTAKLLLADLRGHPDDVLADRSRTFLDSCGFSAEVAGVGTVVAVNFFARSDPGGGAWPYLFWRHEATVRHQALEAGGMRLLDLTARGLDEVGADAPVVAAIFGRAAPRGQQPVVIVWRRAPGAATWSLVQTLGRDSLGGTGVAEFRPRGDGAPWLEARTYRSTTGFDECATCPHIYRTLHFEWQPGGGFRKTGEETASSPYYSFVQLIAALTVGDREMALRFLVDPSILPCSTPRGATAGASRRACGGWRPGPMRPRTR